MQRWTCIAHVTSVTYLPMCTWDKSLTCLPRCTCVTCGIRCTCHTCDKCDMCAKVNLCHTCDKCAKVYMRHICDKCDMCAKGYLCHTCEKCDMSAKVYLCHTCDKCDMSTMKYTPSFSEIHQSNVRVSGCQGDWRNTHPASIMALIVSTNTRFRCLV